MKGFAYLEQWKNLGFASNGLNSPMREKSTYSQLAHSVSDTESLLESENGAAGYTTVTPRRSSWTYRAVTTFIFALFNLAFLVALWFHPTRNQPFDVSNAIFPQVGYETIIFHDDHILPGPETDKIWTAQLPHGNGFTVVDNPQHYQLPKGQAYGDGFNKYGVSWAHQYHCVWMLRDAFWDLVYNRSTLVNVDANEQSKEGGELWHLAHCFGYLRQHIVCNMDMTLEWPTLDGPNAGIINGYEIPHQCKKREALDAYMDQHAPDPALLHTQRLPSRPSHHDLVNGVHEA